MFKHHYYTAGILRYFAELSRHQVEKLEELYRLDLLLFGYSSQVANLSTWLKYQTQQPHESNNRRLIYNTQLMLN